MTLIPAKNGQPLLEQLLRAIFQIRKDFRRPYRHIRRRDMETVLGAGEIHLEKKRKVFRRPEARLPAPSRAAVSVSEFQ